MANKTTKKKIKFRNLLKNRSLDYNQYGRYLVQDFNHKTVFLRLAGELGDAILMLLPIILWVNLFLLIAAGIGSVRFLYAMMYPTQILIIIATVFLNTYVSLIFKGQSFGKLALRMKAVDMENKELDRNTLILREALGKAIPLVLLHLFLGVLGVLIFIILDGLCVLIDKYHRSIIDLILKTKVVMLSDQGRKDRNIEPAEEPKEEFVMESENKYDLRLFSSFSHDGEFEVEDIFKKAKAVGLDTISICDHNSVKANLIAKQLTSLYDVNYVEGITIDCSYQGKHVRLLGYFINSSDQRFATIEYENLAKEKAVSLRRVQLFEEFTGLYVDTEQLLRHSRFQVITPVMIARNILSNVDYQKERLLAPYLSGSKKAHPITHFVEDFFSNGKVAYVPVVHPSLEDMMAAVKASGGKCVLAHPRFSLKEYPELLEEVIALGLDGLEVFNPRHDVNDMKYLLDLAMKYHLSVSAGSEYHGDKKKQFILGKTGCPKGSEEIIERFVYAKK